MTPEILKQADLPSYDEKINFLKSKLIPLLKPDGFVLDAGCGYRNPLFSKKEVGYLVGCDLDYNALLHNSSVSSAVLADLSLLPFSEKFDLILSVDVVEHIEHPVSFIRQAEQVLKKSGFLFLVLPNKNSLFGWGAAIIPLRVKRFLYKLLTGKPLKNEVHFYRLNTVNHLREILTLNGFELIEISMMNYLSSQSLMRLFLFPYYILCKISYFSGYSPNILCLAQKREPPIPGRKILPELETITLKPGGYIT